MLPLCVVCNHSLLPQLQDALILFIWSLEAAAYASIIGLSLWLMARLLLGWRITPWLILVGCVAFSVGRVWS